MKSFNNKLVISSALAHLTRLQILDTLRIKAYGFNELRNELELNPNTLSFHLRMLVNAELVIKSELIGYCLTKLGRETFDDLIQRSEERLKKQEENKIDTK